MNRHSVLSTITRAQVETSHQLSSGPPRDSAIRLARHLGLARPQRARLIGAPRRPGADGDRDIGLAVRALAPDPLASVVRLLANSVVPD